MSHAGGGERDQPAPGSGRTSTQSKKTYAQMITQITNGGHGMTGYKRVLTVAQIQDLAAFVFKSSHH